MRVLVVSGTRSEFGLLVPVIDALHAAPDIECRLALTGVHLLDEYGRTAEQVRDDGYTVQHEIPFYEGTIDDATLPAAIGRGVAGIGAVLAEEPVDWVLILGDRAEAMAAALATYASNGALAHIHGGDRTDSGHIDEGFRHAITRFAHLHFPATVASAARLTAMGEEAERIHCVGSPAVDGLDALLAETPAVLDRHQLVADDYTLLLFHPDREHRERAGDITRGLLVGLLERPGKVVAVYPNSDPGSDAIVREIEAARTKEPERVHVHRSLPRPEFVALLRGARGMVGNSSAGVIEASYIGTPVLNVGDRNRDREPGENIRFVDDDPAAIASGIAALFDDAEWRAIARSAPSPYGDGSAARRIVELLRTKSPLSPRDLGKRITV